MLRWLVIALVVANAVYYAGTHGHLAGLGWPAGSESREPQRLTQQIEPQRLRLLNGPQGAEPVSPATGRPGLEAAATPTNPSSAGQPSPSPAASPQGSSAPASTPGSPAVPAAPTLPATPPTEAATACWQAGGFTEEQAELLRAELRLLGLASSAWQLSEVRSPGRWIVYMGRYDSAEQAARKKAELRALYRGGHLFQRAGRARRPATGRAPRRTHRARGAGTCRERELQPAPASDHRGAATAHRRPRSRHGRAHLAALRLRRLSVGAGAKPTRPPRPTAPRPRPSRVRHRLRRSWWVARSPRSRCRCLSRHRCR
jgi:hypothetical protein